MEASRSHPLSSLPLVLAALLCAGLPTASRAADSPPADWMSAAQGRIAAEEYHVTWQEKTRLSGLDAAWQAPNRAHGFRTYFTERGMRVIPRAEETPSWEWGLSLIGFGRGAEVHEVGRALLSPAKDRIEYDRGPIFEWYVNGPRGLEQGFSIARPPEEIGVPGEGNAGVTAGRRGPDILRGGGSEPVYLVLALTGTLSPAISEDGQAIDFATPQGARVVHYAELKVTDARGTEIRGRFEGFAEAGVRGIRIVVDDADAVYPIEIDPLATSPAWTAESDQTNAFFGYSVATAGDVNGDGYADVIVGALQYDNGQALEGRAFVYHGSASGLALTPAWTAESDLTNASVSFSK